MGKHRPPDVSDDERSYEIGYRKPPTDTRFQKGEGGNRKGRKRRKRKPLAVEMEEILSQRIRYARAARR